MGDSGFAFPLSLLALLAVAIGIVAFAVACRVRNRAVRGIAGVLLLATGVLCGVLSVVAALLLATLGVVALVLAIKAPRPSAPNAEGQE